MTDVRNPAQPDAAAATQDGETYFLIGEVAERTGLTQRTIRYYEELGLLPPPTRTQGDFRLFTARDLSRLEQITRLKKLLGFSLAEIKAMVEGDEQLDQLRSEYHATDDRAVRLDKLEQALQLTRSHLDLVERKLAQMLDLKAELIARIGRYEQKRLELSADLAETAGESTRREASR